MFGHPIEMNFERDGSTYRTVIGGFFSSLVKLFIFLYSLVVFKRLIYYERDNNFTTVGFTDMKENIDYFKTNLTVLHVLRKQRPGGEVSMAKQTEEDLAKYYKAYFNIDSYNWYNAGTDKPIITPRKVKARRCKQSDFGFDADSVKLFKDWAGYLLYCPDTDDAKLLGEPASMRSSMISFKIEKCDYDD